MKYKRRHNDFFKDYAHYCKNEGINLMASDLGGGSAKKARYIWAVLSKQYHDTHTYTLLPLEMEGGEGFEVLRFNDKKQYAGSCFIDNEATFQEVKENAYQYVWKKNRVRNV